MAKDMVVCPDCGKEVKPLGLAAHKRIKHGEGIQVNIGKQENRPEETASITAPKTLTLSGEDLGIADRLIRSGFAKDLNDLTHKSLSLTHSNINRLGGYMENPREETFEDIDRMKDRDIVRKYKELQVKAMEKEIEGKKQETPDDEDKIMKQMEKQIRMKTMKKALDEGDFSFEKMMQWKMADRMFGDTGKSSEVQALQNQLNLMQQQLQQERLVAAQQMQNEKVIQRVEQLSNAQPGLTAQDVLTFTTDKDKAVKEIELRLMAERDKATTEKLVQLQQQITQAQTGGGLTSQRLQAFSEELKAIKAMAGEFGDRPKGAGEYISETISNVASQLQPTLTKMMEAKQRPNPHYEMPLELPPQELPPEPLPPPEFPPSELTAAEQNISNTMSDMYIRKKKTQQ